jgi:phospholipase/carboxylesterase
MKDLNFIETPIKSNQKPEKLVIFLHGYGANKHDLMGLAPEFAKVIPNAHFISVDAPYPWEGDYPDTYQWFSLRIMHEIVILPQVIAVNKVLDKFINEQLQRFDLKDKDLILISFSQGAMIATYHALRRDKEIACVISFSGKVLGIKKLEKELKSKPKIFLSHGNVDTMVPPDSLYEAEEVLNKFGVYNEAYMINGLSHGINAEVINKAKEFISNNIFK